MSSFRQAGGQTGGRAGIHAVKVWQALQECVLWSARPTGRQTGKHHRTHCAVTGEQASTPGPGRSPQSPCRPVHAPRFPCSPHQCCGHALRRCPNLPSAGEMHRNASCAPAIKHFRHTAFFPCTSCGSNSKVEAIRMRHGHSPQPTSKQ